MQELSLMTNGQEIKRIKVSGNLSVSKIEGLSTTQKLFIAGYKLAKGIDNQRNNDRLLFQSLEKEYLRALNGGEKHKMEDAD